MIALVSWTGHSQLSPSEIRHMVNQVASGLASPLVKAKQANIKGKPLRCWQNVQKATRILGGELATGWNVLEIPPRLPQSSHLARIVLNAHALWKQNERWYETTPQQYDALGFLPSVVPARDACVEFFDDMQSLSRLTIPTWDFSRMPCIMRFNHLTFEVELVELSESPLAFRPRTSKHRQPATR